MHKKLFAPLLLSFSLIFISACAHPYDESDLHILPRQELIQIIKFQHHAKEKERVLATIKGIAFGSAAMYAALWWFNANPQTAHKTLLKALSPF